MGSYGSGGVNVHRPPHQVSRVLRRKRQLLRPQVGLSLTPGGCQIGYMDHARCHQLNVF
jgi:hypothetical protein